MPQKQLSAYFLNTDCTDYTDNLSGNAEINVDA